MFFHVEKLLYPVNSPCELVFCSDMPVHLGDPEEYRLRISPVSGLRLKDLNDLDRAKVLDTPLTDIKLQSRGESLVVAVTFPQEDRYVLRLFYKNKEVEIVEIYALSADLFERLPYKGDTHLHSFLSTGGKSAGNESPEYVAAACRWRGLDFVAITDHHTYAPSQRCREYYDKLNTDFLILHGEEVHSPGNPVHIVNLGGKDSVNAWTDQHRDEYDLAVKLKQEAVSKKLSNRDQYTVAACLTVFDKIRDYDGVAVLCHPFWVAGKTKLLNETLDVTDTLFEAPQFDAYELMAGGAYTDGSHVQASYSMGRKQLPVLGCSDSHATSRTGLSLDVGYYSIVFAKELTEQGILNAIREGMCVAACNNRLLGPYRLVRYAYFAMTHMFPQHDTLCERQGQELLRIASSRECDTFLLEQLDGLRDGPSQYYYSLKAEKI